LTRACRITSGLISHVPAAGAHSTEH